MVTLRRVDGHSKSQCNTSVIHTCKLTTIGVILDAALVDFDSTISPRDHPEFWVCEEMRRMKAILQAITELTDDFHLAALLTNFAVHSVGEFIDDFVTVLTTIRSVLRYTLLRT